VEGILAQTHNIPLVGSQLEVVHSLQFVHIDAIPRHQEEAMGLKTMSLLMVQLKASRENRGARWD
jgi:hypothetical protein